MISIILFTPIIMAIIWSLILFLESVFDINSRHKTALAFSIGISSFPLIGHYLLELGSQNQYLTYLPINALTILLIFPLLLSMYNSLHLLTKEVFIECLNISYPQS